MHTSFVDVFKFYGCIKGLWIFTRGMEDACIFFSGDDLHLVILKWSKISP